MTDEKRKADLSEKQAESAKKNTGQSAKRPAKQSGKPSAKTGKPAQPQMPANSIPAPKPPQPVSLAKPGSTLNNGAAPGQAKPAQPRRDAPRSPNAPQYSNRAARQDRDGGSDRDGSDQAVFNQRVFDPDAQDTVPVRPGSRGHGGGGGGGRDRGRSGGQPSGGRPAQGRPGGEQRRPSAGPSTPGQRPAPSGQGRPGGDRRPGAPQSPAAQRKQTQPAPKTRTAPPAAAGKPAARAAAAAQAPVTEITIPNILTVRELAEHMRRSPIEIIKTLMNYGMMVPITESIDFDTAQLIGEELGVTVNPEQAPEPQVVETPEEEPKTLRQRIIAEEKEEDLVIRPPIVTVLGHVDHGKTTLLDAIRETRVVEGEAGGITQHIGAYQVEKSGRKITFLDTPGHEAFTAMRARGAQVTDIAVLVVAADDGVMPQTKEAISHVQAAQVPIIVALNKVDRPQANPDRVKQELADNGVLIEEYGGDTMCVPVSAKFRRGIDDLLESILLVADIEPQRSNPSGECVGTVIEARLDKSRGPMATLLVQNGTLRVGDSIVTGETYAKIRAMHDDKGDPITQATPATPVQILGFAEVPVAGDTFKVVADDRTARAIVAERQADKRAAAAATPAPAHTLESIFAQAQAGQVKELNLILKADVQGSIEPIVNSLEKLGDEKLKVKILHAAAGNISESDVMLAAASGAIILGFAVNVDAATQRQAELTGVSIRQYNIIYNIIEDIEKALKGMLEPVYREVVTGHVEVRAVFKITKVGKIAGSYVLDGEVSRNSLVRVKRNGEVIAEDRIANLKRFQEDVAEVKAGFECGIDLHNFNDFEVGDILEAYRKERVS